jgi:uncharacterized protein YkwD
MRYGKPLALVLCLLAQGISRGAEKPAAEPKFEMTVQEKAVLERTNQERAKENLPALKPSPLLFKVARAHSANMAKQEKMDHVLDGKKPHERVQDAGYRFAWVGENVAAGTNLAPKEAMDLWMNSEGHRGNILGKDYDEIGIGLARTEKGDVYYTQVFGRAR